MLGEIFFYGFFGCFVLTIYLCDVGNVARQGRLEEESETKSDIKNMVFLRCTNIGGYKEIYLVNVYMCVSVAACCTRLNERCCPRSSFFVYSKI